MDAKLTKIYYSPKGYWKGMAAIKKLANAAKVSEDVAKQWLTKQALWQVYLPGPHYIPRPKFDVSIPNAVHQADLSFLPHDKLELLAGECEVHAVRVHLDELEVLPVEVEVQELVVELEHAELRELVDHDTHLEWVLDGKLVLAQLDLVGVANLLEVLEPGRAEMLVDLFLIAGVQDLILPLHCFDELAIGAVAQELEDFRKEGLVLVCVALAPVVRHLVHEPAEDLARLVVDGTVNRGKLEAAVEVPLQEGGVQENLLRRQDPQELRLLRKTLSPALLQVVMHVIGHCAVGNTAVDEELGKLRELRPQLLGDFDVHFCKSEPLLGVKELGKYQRCGLRVIAGRDNSGTAGHLLHHGAGVERVGIVPQDAPAHLCILVLV